MFIAIARWIRLTWTAYQTQPWKTAPDWIGEGNQRPRIRLW